MVEQSFIGPRKLQVALAKIGKLSENVIEQKKHTSNLQWFCLGKV